MTAKDLDGNVSEHLINPLGAVKCDKGKVSWWGTDPNISHLRRKPNKSPTQRKLNNNILHTNLAIGLKQLTKVVFATVFGHVEDMENLGDIFLRF